MAKFLAPAVSQTITLTEHSSERLVFVTGSRAVGEDCAITDALFKIRSKNHWVVLN